MRTLAFDGRIGASGDMILGALVSVGADPQALGPVEASLPVSYDVQTVTKNGIAATTVDVRHEDADAETDGHTHEHEDDGPSHEHDGHNHEQDGHVHDGHGHGEHGHGHAEGAGPNRTYAEVVELVESMGLPSSVERDALAVFELLGEAEANVHGTDITETHFHEVGADDAIADVVGTALLLADLDVERVVTAPLSAGVGTG